MRRFRLLLIKSLARRRVSGELWKQTQTGENRRDAPHGGQRPHAATAPYCASIVPSLPVQLSPQSETGRKGRWPSWALRRLIGMSSARGNTRFVPEKTLYIASAERIFLGWLPAALSLASHTWLRICQIMFDSLLMRYYLLTVCDAKIPSQRCNI